MSDSQKKMSVAIVSSAVGKTPEDITYSFIFDEAFRLAEKGLKVHIVRPNLERGSFSYGICYHGFERRIESRVIGLMLKNLSVYPLVSIIRSPLTLYWENLYAMNVSKVADRNSVDLIHSHFAYPEGLVGLLTKRNTRIPLVVTVHGYDILSEPSEGYGLRLTKNLDAVIRRVLKNADAIIAASRATYNEAAKIVNTADRVHFIPNGVDVERFNPNISGARIRRKLGVEGRTVIFALRAHERKYGLEYLIKAIPAVKKERKDVVFIIGGEGSRRPFHQDLAKKLGVRDKVLFVGRISQDLVPYYYAVADMIIVPSLQEAFGLSVSEAMACGKPVIGSRVGGILDQITDGYNGFLVQPRSYEEIAEKILWLIRNPKEAKQMGIDGRRIVEQKFDINKRIEKIITLYRMLLVGRS